MQTGVTIGLVFLAVLVVVLINTWYVRRENNKDYDQMELRAPLVEFKKPNREEEAAVAAERGYTECHACGFENFQATEFCAVCGEALDEAAKKRAAKAKQPNTLSVRRARASMRKEWMRKVDVEGRVFWFRQGLSVATFPGYAVSFQPQQPKLALDAAAGKTETLRQEAANAKLELVEASAADATAFALGGKLESASHAKDVVEQAAQVFPTKYAVFVAKAAAVLAPSKKQLLNLKVNRTYLVEQTLEHLSCVDTKFVRAEMALKFTAKKGIAPADPYGRAWFAQLNALIGNPNTGLFTLVDKSNQTFYLNKYSQDLVGDDYLTFFYAAGRLLGRTLLEGKVWGFHLATPLLKIILGQPLSFPDLAFFDPELYKSLEWLVKNDTGAESLHLTFSVTETNAVGETVVVDLIPNGRNIAVTDANKLEYLERRFRYTLFESVSSQLFAFLKGVYEVVPQDMLMALDFEELDYILCGSDVIDVDEWERVSRYNVTIHAHPAKRWFWQFAREMSLEHKRRLLHFTTGLTRVPIGGFAALTNYSGHVAPFTIIGNELLQGRIIRGQPCFNQIELPNYVKKKEFRANLFGILDNYDVMSK